MVASLWLFLFVNNARLMPFLHGFDSQAHLDYIEYVQERHALPLPTEGFEMFQPPFYYVLSAVALSLCGLSADAPAAIIVLRLLTFLFGALQFTLVLAQRAALFPAAPNDPSSRPGLRRFLADAVVPVALRDERNAWPRLW